MIYQITHRTTYAYSEPVALCHNLAHLTPRTTARQVCHASRLHITPAPAVVMERIDYFGNPVTFFTVQDAHRELTILAEHRIEVLTDPLPRDGDTRTWEEVRDHLKGARTAEDLEACGFLFDSPYIAVADELREYGRRSFRPQVPWREALLDLNQRVHRDFRYDPRATTVTTPLHDAFVARRGVCQDFAHIVVGCLRSLGLPARYVSGYLRTTPPPGQARLVGVDASHAWVAAYSPHFGWIEVDPTNGVGVSKDYILLGWGRDYDDVCPLKGVILGGGPHTLTVGVDVIPEERASA